MRYANSVSQTRNRLHEWFDTAKKEAAERRMRRGTYVRTLLELHSSSDYDLADLGICRLSIKDIAHAAAYGDLR